MNPGKTGALAVATTSETAALNWWSCALRSQSVSHVHKERATRRSGREVRYHICGGWLRKPQLPICCNRWRPRHRGEVRRDYWGVGLRGLQESLQACVTFVWGTDSAGLTAECRGIGAGACTSSGHLINFATMAQPTTYRSDQLALQLRIHNVVHELFHAFANLFQSGSRASQQAGIRSHPGVRSAPMASDFRDQPPRDLRQHERRLGVWSMGGKHRGKDTTGVHVEHDPGAVFLALAGGRRFTMRRLLAVADRATWRFIPNCAVGALIIGIATSCARGTVTPSESPTPARPLPIEPSATDSPVPPVTVYSTATWTPTPDQTKALLLDMLQTNGGCALPCIWGLTPGDTSEQSARQSLARFNGSIPNDLDIEFHDFGDSVRLFAATGIDERTIIADISAYFEHEELSFVSFHASGREGWLGDQLFGDPVIQAAINGFDLSRVLSLLGSPEKILAFAWRLEPGSQEGWSPLSLILYYPRQGMLVEYVMPAEIEGDRMLGRPRKAEVATWACPGGKNIPVEEVVSKGAGDGINPLNADAYMDIEDVTGLAHADFVERFSGSGSEDCLTTSASTWPEH